MEKFNAFEFNAENVIGGTAVTTPCICVPSVTVNAAPVVKTVKSVLGGTLGLVGGILGKVKTTATAVTTPPATTTPPTTHSTSAHVGVNVGIGLGTGCGC